MIDFNIDNFKNLDDEINITINNEINTLEKNIHDIKEMNNIMNELICNNKINEIENINNNFNKDIDIGTNKLILSNDNINKYRIKKIYGYLIVIITFPFMIHKLFR